MLKPRVISSSIFCEGLLGSQLCIASPIQVEVAANDASPRLQLRKSKNKYIMPGVFAAAAEVATWAGSHERGN